MPPVLNRVNNHSIYEVWKFKMYTWEWKGQEDCTDVNRIILNSAGSWTEWRVFSKTTLSNRWKEEMERNKGGKTRTERTGGSTPLPFPCASEQISIISLDLTIVLSTFLVQREPPFHLHCRFKPHPPPHTSTFPGCQSRFLHNSNVSLSDRPIAAGLCEPQAIL